jgi:hypothetical protein
MNNIPKEILVVISEDWSIEKLHIYNRFKLVTENLTVVLLHFYEESGEDESCLIIFRNGEFQVDFDGKLSDSLRIIKEYLNK